MITEFIVKCASRYLQQLKSLNQCLVRWIDQHVQSNPYCILTPVFRDYDKHVDDLNRKFNISPDQLSSSSEAVVNTNGLPVAGTSALTGNSADNFSSTSLGSQGMSSLLVLHKYLFMSADCSPDSADCIGSSLCSQKPICMSSVFTFCVILLSSYPMWTAGL